MIEKILGVYIAPHMSGFFILVVLWNWGDNYKLTRFKSEDQICLAVNEAKENGAKYAAAYELDGDMSGLDSTVAA